jgi:hypothetical protein
MPPPDDTTDKNPPLGDVSEDEITSLVDDVLKSGKQVPLATAADGQAEGERLHARVIATQMQQLAEQLGAAPGAAPVEEDRDEWWFEVPGGRIGPINLKKIRLLWEDGELTPDSLCWREGFSAWVPLFRISDLAQALSPKADGMQKVGAVTADLRREEPAAAPAAWKPRAGEALERSARLELEASQRKEPAPLEVPLEPHDDTAGSFVSLPPVVPAPEPATPPRSRINVGGAVISGLVAGVVVVSAIVAMRYLPEGKTAAAPSVPAPVAPPPVVVAPPSTPISQTVAPTVAPKEATAPREPVVPRPRQVAHTETSAKVPAARSKPETVEDKFAEEFSPPGHTPLSLTTSQVMEVVLKHKAAVNGCVRAQHAQEPDSSGRLVMRWNVHLDGHVSDISVKSEDLVDSPMGACLAKEIEGWTFPEHEVEHPPVEFPFPF